MVGLMALGIAGAPAAFAQSAPIVWFSDDFSSGTLSKWAISPLGLESNWSAASETAAYNGGGHTQLYAGAMNWADYTVETKFRLDNGSNYPGGLRGRLNTTTGQSYAAWIYPSQGVIKLYRATAWHIDTAGLTELGSASVGTIAPSVFHTLSLTFAGSQIVVKFNGTDVISTTDSALASGGIALDVSNQPIQFDDVRVFSNVPPPPTVLFSDDFGSNTLANWTASPLGLFSNWSAAAGTAAYNGGGHTQIYAGSDAWTDYTVTAKIRLANGSNYPGGIRGRVNTSTGQGYAVWLYPGTSVIRLFRSAAWHIDTPGLTELAEAPLAISAGVFHTVALTFAGSGIQVQFDGTTVISTTDTAPLASGAIALDVSNQPIEYDDIVVSGTAPIDNTPPSGPGGPILVLSTASDPFSRYYGEILLAEGLNQYRIRDIGSIDAATLANFDVVILPSIPLTASQVSLLTNWVTAGGNLIAIRPDAQLAGLLGLTTASGTLANGYLGVDTSTAAGSGITAQTVQFHGTADFYTLSGATAVATLFSNATTSASRPAVTLRDVGSSGGQAAAFTYDLARSVVWTRQGNPAWSGQERESFHDTLIRSDDLFFGAAASDPQPDWVDLNKVAIPQADEQQRLLVNLIEVMNRDRKPLPRFWYLPRGKRAAIVMTGDDHANNGTTGRFQGYQAISPAGCSVDRWECIRGTSYIYPNTPITPAQASAFEADGFEIAAHVTTNCGNWTPATLPSFYTNDLNAFAANFPALATPVTNRTHCIAWSDYVTQPKVEHAFGIRFDTNYYYWPGEWIQDRPGLFTGSGMPMRFADLDGTLIDVYQAVTQMPDESLQSFPFTIDSLLDKALGPEGFYAILTANMHTDSASSAGSDAIVNAALTRGVPVVTAKQMLRWLDGRNGSFFANIAKSGASLSFTVNAAAGSDGLQALLPIASASGTLSTITRNGAPVSFVTQTIKGVSYAVLDAPAGNYLATYSAP
jgi:hypothetical protein